MRCMHTRPHRRKDRSHTPSALNAGAKRSGATCHMAMPQCCYLAKGAKRPSQTTNTIKFDRILFDLCNSSKRFDLSPFDQKNSTCLQPPSRLNQGSLCNPETTGTEAEARKIEKYRGLIDNGYIFQLVALEVQGSLGECSEIFITRLCKMLCRSHDDQRAGSFLKQRISITLQIRNASCVLGTVSDRGAFGEIYYI